MTMLLALNDVHKSFGALKVTDGISLAVNQGETLGILGPNGAGKTTLFNLISGDIQPDQGSITFGGADISGLPAHKRCRLGVGRSYQVPQPYSGLTVFENCLVAATAGAQLPEEEAYVVCHDVLQSTGLLNKANQLAGSLTLLNRKRLELARALCTRPKLLLLDEIAGGLTEHEAKALVDEIKAIKARGVTMIWIEHVVHALLAVADRLFVLNFGARLAEGAPTDVMNDPEVKRVYMGLDA
ncbi:ABC transporter ATP-binding protein [Pusillimonas sp. NJUB218]|uniref:ABC transporter ATP-binding protein n=1 Tax=Pusillimonas sp. NJUB218 TaxID=2023230 RepID=UPI000F4C5DAC|nr:ABC transporter ATP-binding protein [Pusillimonas sp. NJUB218]ROT45893.1 ABC transporter ATP-binding protein [Pusillimonas sp. NJUB218]